MKDYINELAGQYDFYHSYLPLVDNELSVEDVISDYNDGIVNGNLLEFKLYINDVSSVLFQSIKYLSSMRIKGKPIPKNILLVSLNNEIVYVFDSEDYLVHIEKIYFGSASINNTGFSSGEPREILKFGNSELDESKLVKYLRTEHFTKINIDENCIVGWAENFYRNVKGATKADFIGDSSGKIKIIGEIRVPNKLKKFINPYTGKTNAQFHYLMDRLNDTLQKKNLGAFYTPTPYAEKSLELVRKAIARVPAGNDYIILDRCAGTGNLQKNMSDEELSHCVLSTIEYYEYKVLLELLGDKVRHIIPPTEKDDTFNMGLVRGADALSEEYINNEVIRQYVDDDKTTIILFENPPYAETTSVEHQRTGTGKKSSGWKKSFVVREMKKYLKKNKISGLASNDIGNVFIWSGFNYYLRQPTDSYIVYSPVKYWKAQHLINKKIIDGYGFNRKHFHTNTNAFISCILWSQEDASISELQLKGYDIENGKLSESISVPVKRVYNSYSKVYFDKRSFSNDMNPEDGILCGLNGLESFSKTRRVKPILNDNILGYMAVYSSGFDNPDLHSSLLVAGRYDGNGFFLRKDNYLEKLPMFAASRYITYNKHWTQRSNIMKSADGHQNYIKDVRNGKINQFLYKCLLFTVLETQNHMRTFYGTDKRLYKNELTFDITLGETIASQDIRKLKLNEKESKLLNQWDLVLKEAKKTDEYNPNIAYGVYQIISELNTSYKNEKKETIYNYPNLNGHLKSMKTLLREYYNEQIVPILFEYQFLK